MEFFHHLRTPKKVYSDLKVNLSSAAEMPSKLKSGNPKPITITLIMIN